VCSAGPEGSRRWLFWQEPGAGCGWMLVADAFDTASAPGPAEGFDALPDPAITGTVVVARGFDGDAPP
jgi:hypothetical protein